MDIPIKNIYYLLCYAYNKLEEGKVIDLQAEDTTELVNLFARILINGTSGLIRRGIDRGYISQSDEMRSIKGKVNFSICIKRNLLSNVKAFCDYDELSYNVLHNQILKSTIKQLTLVKEIDKNLKSQLLQIHRQLFEIEDITLYKSLFRRVQLHSNNSFYALLLKICELIIDNIIVSEEKGPHKFRDFLKDEKQMASLFEEFVRNFYKIEQNEFYVNREYVEWDAKALDAISDDLLPRMQTDISMESKDRKIIIETKYQPEALSKYYDIEKIRQSHLLQLFGYLKHLEHIGGLDRNCEGILLYPTVTKELDYKYESQGHKISVKTINLNQKWPDIHNDLLAIIN